jgi:hypothetical protein
MEEATLLLVKHNIGHLKIHLIEQISDKTKCKYPDFFSLPPQANIRNWEQSFFKPESGLPRDLASAGCEYDRPRLHTSRFPTFVATPLTTYTSLLQNVNPATSDGSEDVHQDTPPTPLRTGKPRAVRPI